MKCRYCGTEIQKDMEACPQCGKPLTRLRIWQIVVMCLAALLVLFVLVCVILKDQGVDMSWLDPDNWAAKKEATQQTAPQTEQEQQQEEIQFMYELNRDSYTASSEDTAAQAAQIAAKVGDVELTNSELQIHYWYGAYEFVYNYYYYLSSMGLDLTLPLDEQSYMGSEETWQRTFLENALNNWHKYTALALQAKQENYVMSDATQAELEELLAQLDEQWQADGYASADEMLQAECGPLASMDGYKRYMETYYYATDYFNTQYAQMVPSEEEVEAYFTEHADELSFTKETKSYNVRHILIEPQGGTTDESGNVTYTDEEWEACRAEAQALLDQWKSTDGTETGFASLAAEKSTDGGSSANGGLYSGLTEETNFVTEFKDWYLDESRQAGDTGLVKSVYGYHIMYFSGADTVWYDECYALAHQAKSEEFVKQCMERWEMVINDDQIALGEVSLAG